jgi:hypothetical protein
MGNATVAQIACNFRGGTALCWCAALNSLIASSSPVNSLYAQLINVVCHVIEVAGDPGEEGSGDRPYFSRIGFSLFCNTEVAQARLSRLARYAYARCLAWQSTMSTASEVVKSKGHWWSSACRLTPVHV